MIGNSLCSPLLQVNLVLMMLIEAYELNGIHVISANTDGVTIMIKKDQLELMDALMNGGKS